MAGEHGVELSPNWKRKEVMMTSISTWGVSKSAFISLDNPADSTWQHALYIRDGESADTQLRVYMTEEELVELYETLHAYIHAQVFMVEQELDDETINIKVNPKLLEQYVAIKNGKVNVEA
jgi:hypothetical protein